MRQSFSLFEILSMSLPALLNEGVDRIFFYLQHVLDDELVIQAFESFEVVIIGIASFFLLGRRWQCKFTVTPRLTATHWSSLILVCSAVMSIELASTKGGAVHRLPFFPSFMGAVGAGLEGVSGVVTEKLLKKHESMDISQQNIWIYLSLYCHFFTHSWGALLYMLIMFISGFRHFVQSVTFTNFNRYTVLYILS